MKRSVFILVFSLFLIHPCPDSPAQDSWTPEQLEVLQSMERLSAATAPDGAGPDEYAAVLAEDFSRWTMGSSVINGKKDWVDGMRDWFDDGWRVSDRNQDVLGISISGGFAFVRRIVAETYRGPDGDTNSSRAGLSETWIRGKEGWLLSRVNAVVLDNE